MHLPFSLRGIAGDVDITLEITRNPEELGAMPEAVGLPHCHATVEYPGLGYAGMLGWVQLVRSTDNNSRGEQFEMDPLTFLGQVSHPFAFFGVTPTLFDAPARRSRADLEWLAHSFLCYLRDDDEEASTVQAIAGFSWGFIITGAATTVTPARPLGATDWNRHRDLLHAEHPGWQFAEGFEVV